MTSHPSHRPVSALRARMIEDMSVRGFSEKTRNDYIRNVRAFAAFIGKSPHTATAEDLRAFQLYQTQTVGQGGDLLAARGLLCRERHGRKLMAVVPLIGHLVGHDQMVLGVDDDLYIVADGGGAF